MQCYGPDDIALGLTQFRKHLYPDFKTNQNYNEHWIIIFYDSTDVIHYQRIPVCSVWSFISSIGGSLGLFLGFSGYSVLSYLINCMKQKTELSSRVNTTYSDEVLPETHHENGNEPKLAKNDIGFDSTLSHRTRGAGDMGVLPPIKQGKKAFAQSATKG